MRGISGARAGKDSTPIEVGTEPFPGHSVSKYLRER